MNREILVLIETEVEIRDAWITKNEARMSLPQTGDVQDLEGFQQLKESHEVSHNVFNKMWRKKPKSDFIYTG